MTYTPEDPTAETLKSFSNVAQEKAQDAYKASSDYVRENPVPVIVGALVVGAALGLLLAPRPKKDSAQAARDLLDTLYSEISDKLPQLRKQAVSTKDNLVDQLQDLSTKLKWW